MNAVDRKVKQLVGKQTVRAYGLPGHLREQPPENLCKWCRGDGCVHCDYTGDAN